MDQHLALEVDRLADTLIGIKLPHWLVGKDFFSSTLILWCHWIFMWGLLRNRILDLLINKLVFSTLTGFGGFILRCFCRGRGLFDTGITFKASSCSCSTVETLLDGFNGGLLFVLGDRQLPWRWWSDVKATISWRLVWRFCVATLFTLRLFGILGAVTVTLRRGYGRLEFEFDAKRK